MAKRYVIVGGDAAGMSAASQIRRQDPEGEIIVFEKEGVISYAQCGLPYFVGGVVAEKKKLIARTAEDFHSRYNIDVRLYHEVLQFKPQDKQVRVYRRQEKEEIIVPYDVLLIGTGSAAIVPPWEGRDLPGVFTLKTMGDAEKLLAWLEEHTPTKAVVIGGGYIGLETAEALHTRGFKVTVLDLAPQLIPTFDAPIAEIVQDTLKRHGVEVYLNEEVVGLEGDEKGVRAVVTKNGSFPADLVIISIGVRPVSELAREAGIELGPRNAILVNERLQTNISDIFAAGDCATHFHRIKNAPDYVPLGTTANKQGRIAGVNMAGGYARFAGIVGTAIVKVFDRTIARSGLSEKECDALGVPYQTVSIKARPISHYYPWEDEVLTLRLHFHRDNRKLLGGQIAGGGGVDKRIDVLATALFHGMTIDDLQALDLAYAPPYNSVWDPLQQAATVVQRGKE
ncbi:MULTISPECIES: FAD-dependent oxidoreductase [Thermoanaerobacter]|uniref:FAD-dependent pyridine nucleotide-disulphide oxidoreductase n=2 Tax=Thermoanaerobacter TaxID=1754 RepID=B0K8E1_THEP3|nr:MULTISPECIES: FAD-dependent oxidoreductase [Thermoanaerobacter]ABY95873.1 FAD-dependent pyridine nucleotide-disulphide oxidoreductase [Thermoanaerobacter pseudethanolicus ATCC 33223]ADV80799.1 FAD-dependent pyridine nucleotide-disulfide oxidoreductase [Thermoanaerobacter brockii subsp. finnii Ako-1]HBW59838.1 CoA-disulfide reductase [Thermoanaerobacter sp.]